MPSNSFSKPAITAILVGIIVIVLGSIYWFNTTVTDQTMSEAEPKISPATSTLTSTPITTNLMVSPVSPVSPILPLETAPLPAQIEALLQSGLARYDQKDFQDALQVFDQVLSLDPTNFLAYNAKGAVYTELKDYDRALTAYDKVIELQSLFPHGYYNRGRVNYLLKKYDQAIADFQKAIELSPPEFGYRASGNIGLIYHQQGQYDQALDTFNKALSYDATKADTYYYRGETYTAMGKFEEAVSDFQAATNRFPGYDLAYQGLAYAHYRMGQFDQAQAALKQAAAISPESSVLHFYQALVYLAANQADQAKLEVSEAMDTIGAVSEEQQKALFSRVLADLEVYRQKNPDKTKTVEEIVNLIPEL
jgi:tetratricopeptide (TPR) repeat protein